MGKHEDESGLPLAGVKIVEMSGLGPTPFGTMLLADLGAEVVRIERLVPDNPLGGDPALDFLYRGRPALAVDLKTPEGLAFVRRLAAGADVLVEGFRPGTMERLGLGPVPLLEDNPRLVYARMTGWGQEGPLAGKAGHDINYLALSGALWPLGPHGGPPLPPLNLVGNFGGGGAFLALGVLAALQERNRSGRGQVVDAAMLDGISVLLTQLAGWTQMGRWREGRGGNLLDGSAYFYRCYETADGRHIAVGALEHAFHDAFVRGLGLDPADFCDHLDPAHWASRAAIIAPLVAARTQAAWVEAFAELDACVTPVLSQREAATHPANRARTLHTFEGEAYQPSPAPRFSRSARRDYAHAIADHPMPADLAGWGLPAGELAELRRRGIVGGDKE